MFELDTSRVQEAANADPEFRMAARYWNAAVRFDVGPDTYIMRVADGRIAAFSPADGSAGPCDLHIRGETVEWERLLEAVPRPYYQDLFMAGLAQGIRVEGDQDSYYAYYGALSRVIHAMRLVRNGGSGSTSPTTVRRSSNAQFDDIVGRYIYLTIDGTEYRVYFEEAGQGIPLLLQHTAGADNRQWRHLLADRDIQQHFRMIAYDLPYHGKSLPPSGVEWWKQEYRLTKDFLMKVVVTLAKELGLVRPVYMGSSIGGHLAGDLALYHPDEFRAVIGINGTLATRSKRRVDPERSHHPRISNDAKAALMLSFTSPTAPEAYRRETVWGYSQGAPPVFKGDMHYFYTDHDLTETASQIDTSKVAVYMLSGEYDVSSHPTGAPEMVRRIKGAKYTLMPGIGHFAMSEDPQRFKQYLTPVLDEIRRGSS